MLRRGALNGRFVSSLSLFRSRLFRQQIRYVTVKQILGKNRPLPIWHPESPDFLPSPLGPSPLEDFIHETVDADILVADYRHTEEDISPRKRNSGFIDRYNRWDGSSPYHKNRISKPLPDKKPLLPLPTNLTHKNVPRLKNIVLSTMVKEAIAKKEVLLSSVMAFRSITGVHPEILYAKKDVAVWKLRKGAPVGVKVVLEGENMYSFLAVLAQLVLPRVREFNGLCNNIGDLTGNITIGFPEGVLPLFPQIENIHDMFPCKLPGFRLSFVTTTNETHLARFLLSSFIPFDEKKTTKRKAY
ncbi:ribosomal protein subunit L7 [Schizosaccharomyces japonicus yFS275]|uniref:Ribosomal protein subunit L7 n=1 Tax=Schizosaccharomyces japonicus (strain yFS275 / FY16936) TaxID=402676 RepID=B6JYQ4_SCHJY|nr:ribosomal protein subunit L7 [Schizosaccharomyces japonicus yFS275]EEB06672.1 ribosomal protein subunit L7 [Schizosaccharomyces japonicus yFS275]